MKQTCIWTACVIDALSGQIYGQKPARSATWTALNCQGISTRSLDPSAKERTDQQVIFPIKLLRKGNQVSLYEGDTIADLQITGEKGGMAAIFSTNKSDSFPVVVSLLVSSDARFALYTVASTENGAFPLGGRTTSYNCRRQV